MLQAAWGFITDAKSLKLKSTSRFSKQSDLLGFPVCLIGCFENVYTELSSENHKFQDGRFLVI